MNGAQALFKALIDAGHGIPNIEMARVREGDPNEKMLAMMHVNNPSLDWVRIAEGRGGPATRATTAEEFHKQFETAMGTKGPKLIEARIVQNLQPTIISRLAASL